jgi:hypothetical protein
MILNQTFEEKEEFEQHLKHAEVLIEDSSISDLNLNQEKIVQEEKSMISSNEYDVEIEKTSKGFGLYFAKKLKEEESDEHDTLIVDGFIEEGGEEDQSGIHMGDTLVGINEIDCRDMEPLEIVGLLRNAPIGKNTFRFKRQDEERADSKITTTTSTNVLLKGSTSLMGAFLKVKSKLKAEMIDGEDEEELKKEQEENEAYERKWLEEFEKLKQEQVTKWDTCTYTADEFCGILYHSSDLQQKEYYLREYPTLMEPWKEADLNTSNNNATFHPDWPPVVVKYETEITYHDNPIAPDASDNANTAITCDKKNRTIESSPCLFQAIDCLRTEFQWQRKEVLAFGLHLESEMTIFSCQQLKQALEERHGYPFERHIQSIKYPRVTKTICRFLLEKAKKIVRDLENQQQLVPSSL